MDHRRDSGVSRAWEYMLDRYLKRLHAQFSEVWPKLDPGALLAFIKAQGGAKDTQANGVTRAQAAQILGYRSAKSIQRMEEAGLLAPLPTPKTPRHYRMADVLAIRDGRAWRPLSFAI